MLQSDLPETVASRERTVLLIAFHFPPMQGSSGLQRTLRFAKHLPKFGWRPKVLTVTPTAYEATSTGKGNEIPEGVDVVRAYGLDAARQLSIGGYYPRWLALPDRWATWRFWGLRAARRIVERHSVDAIWSTFPIASAHEIGLGVAAKSGLPWVAEFRDPMWQGDYPPDPRVNRYWQELERKVFAGAHRIVVTTPSARRDYAERYGSANAEKLEIIENGYDEETFARASPQPNERANKSEGPFVLLHSGLIYPSERDPTHFFAAIASLKERGVISSKSLQVILRASGNEGVFREQLAKLAIADIVHLEPPLEYLSALREMMTVDGLLLLQAANCNAQIPAKLYEYLRAGRPVLALTDPIGDTAITFKTAGVGELARLDSQAEIEAALPRFMAAVRGGSYPKASDEVVSRYSREQQAGQLARTLDAVVAANPRRVTV